MDSASAFAGRDGGAPRRGFPAGAVVSAGVVSAPNRERLASLLYSVGLDKLGDEARYASQFRPWRAFCWVENAVRAAIVACSGPFRGRRQLPLYCKR